MPARRASEPERGARTDGRVTRAQRLREERRAQVLGAARALFADKGYHATSINDIIDATGIARGTFYLYFESKRAIFDELLDSFFVTLTGTVKRIDVAPSAPPPAQQMYDTVGRIFDILDGERPMARILIREAVGLDVEFDRKLADFYGRVAELIERALRSGVAMGLVRPCEPRFIAWCVLGSVKEVCDHLFVVGPRAGGGSRDFAALSRELVDFNLRGLFR